MQIMCVYIYMHICMRVYVLAQPMCAVHAYVHVHDSHMSANAMRVVEHLHIYLCIHCIHVSVCFSLSLYYRSENALDSALN